MEIQVHELSESQLNELSDMIVAKMMKSQESKRKQIRSNAYHNLVRCGTNGDSILIVYLNIKLKPQS